MKAVLKLACYALLVLSFSAGAFGSSQTGSAPVPDRDWDITLEVINQFQCPFAVEIRGLDYVDDAGAVSFTSDRDNKVYTCSADDGTYIGELLMDFVNNPHPFGVCYDADGDVYVNEFSRNKIRWHDGVVWDDYPNPASNKGSGMDFDGTYIWETYWTDGVYRFFPDGSGAEFYAMPEVGAQLSGLTVFPFNGNLWVMVASHGEDVFNFYEFDGATMNYIATVDCPLVASQSYGLAYSAERGTIFWSYALGSNDWIAELGIGIVDDTDVGAASFGLIKAVYR